MSERCGCYGYLIVHLSLDHSIREGFGLDMDNVFDCLLLQAKCFCFQQTLIEPSSSFHPVPGTAGPR